jgi:hypothetical protein
VGGRGASIVKPHYCSTTLLMIVTTGPWRWMSATSRRGYCADGGRRNSHRGTQRDDDDDPATTPPCSCWDWSGLPSHTMPQRYWPTSPLPSQPGGWALAGRTAGDSGTVVIVVEGATVVAVVVGAGVVVRRGGGGHRRCDLIRPCGSISVTGAALHATATAEITPITATIRAICSTRFSSASDDELRVAT